MIDYYWLPRSVRPTPWVLLSIMLTMTSVSCSLPNLPNSGDTNDTTSYKSGMKGPGIFRKKDFTHRYYIGTSVESSPMPPILYRITIEGDGSIGTGWIPYNLVPTLLDKHRPIPVNPNPNPPPKQRIERVFGPDGFKEAPEGYTVVVVLGKKPEQFFSLIDETIENLSQVSTDAFLAYNEPFRMTEELRSEIDGWKKLRDELATLLREYP